MSNELDEYINGLSIYAYTAVNGKCFLAKEVILDNGKIVLENPIRLEKTDDGKVKLYLSNIDHVDYDPAVFIRREEVTFRAKYKHFRISLAKKLYKNGAITAEEIAEYSTDFEETFKSSMTIEEFITWLDASQQVGLN